MSTSADGSLILCALFLHNTKYVTSYKSQQVEREKRRNWKNLRGTVISVNEVWYHILKYPEVINNLNFWMIQTILLETRTGKSLRNPDNPTRFFSTQSYANATNNPDNELRRPNELRQLLSTNGHFTEIKYSINKDLQLYKTFCKLDLILRYILSPPELMTIFYMFGKYYRWFNASPKPLKENVVIKFINKDI